MAFSSVQIQQTFDGAIPTVTNCASDIANMASICQAIAGIVESEDSGLAGAWNQLGGAFQSVSQAVNRTCNDLKRNVDDYVKKTRQTEGNVSEEVNSVSSKATEIQEAMSKLGK